MVASLAACQNAPAPAPAGAAVESHPGPAIVLPTEPGAHLTYLIPAGWHVALAEPGQHVVSIEYVPPGQTRAQWTDMVTAAWIHYADHTHLADLSATLHAQMTTYCTVPPAFDPPLFFNNPDYDATLETIRCGKNRENAGYITMIRTLKTPGGYYQLQRAWHRPASANSQSLKLSDAERAAARRILDTLRLIEAIP